MLYTQFNERLRSGVRFSIEIIDRGLVLGVGTRLETLLDQRMTPRTLMKSLGLDASSLDLTKHDPNQPRVPAGNNKPPQQGLESAPGVSFKPAHQRPNHPAYRRRKVFQTAHGRLS